MHFAQLWTRLVHCLYLIIFKTSFLVWMHKNVMSQKEPTGVSMDFEKRNFAAFANSEVSVGLHKAHSV